MRIHETTTYPGALPDVLDALVSRELAADRAAAFGGSTPEHRVDGLTATTVVPIPPDRVPDYARPFLKGTSSVTITQEWDGRGSDRARAPFRIDLGKLPVIVSLTQTLVAAGDSTESIFDGELKVRIPIVGGKVEKKVAAQIGRILRKDTALVTKLLS